MKKLSPKGTRLLKVFHLLFAMTWLASVLAMGVLTLLKPVSSGDSLYILKTANLWIDPVLTIPGAMCTLVTGIIYGAFTPWGFFKQPWITVKWIFSVLVILFGTFYSHPLSLHALELTEQSREAALGNIEVIGAMRTTLFSSAINAVFLIALVVISVFKPWKRRKRKAA